MKKLIMCLCFVVNAAFVFSGGNREPVPVAPTAKPPAGEPSAIAKPPPSAQNVQKPRYFEGDGGKGLTLAVLAPTGKGLDAEERYWLPLVQGSITGDFNKYSAITIIDRQNLEKILDEQTLSASGNFSEEDYIRIGELANARYILAGSITKTPSGSLIIEFAVSDIESGVRAASFPPKNISPAALENLSAVKEASADILGQLGVRLTAEGIRELTKVDDTRIINAETALSKAITAQKDGTVVEALSYYFQAVNYDSSLPEAASRLSVLSRNISSGNMGADIRNDIQWRREWAARLAETEEYYTNYTKNPPYYFVYSTKLRQGSIDYEKETVPISFEVELFPDATWLNTAKEVVNLVRRGLEATGRSREWGFESWPEKAVSKSAPFADNFKKFTVEAELINDEGASMGRHSMVLASGWGLGFGPSLQIFPFFNGLEMAFPAVNANLITDKITINIVSVDGLKPDAAAKSKRFNIMPRDEYDKIPEVKSEKYYDIISMNYIDDMDVSPDGALVGYKGKLKDVVIPPYGKSGKVVRSIGERAFEAKGLTSVTIPDSVTSIGDHAFYRNNLTSVTIPNSVTSIGSLAFSENKLTSVIIPNSVTSIGSFAFSANKLTSVTIPDSVTSIGDHAFYRNNLTSVTIPNSVTSIGRGAFSENNLTSVTIPNSVTTIRAAAFKDNNLTSITIGANVEIMKEWNNDAFEYGFTSFYADNGKKAGTYVRSGWNWTRK
jgi:hypothetical protein